MKPSVYIDSTIPSLYYDERSESVFRREKTRLWWNNHRKNFDCYTSLFTRKEVAKERYPNQEAVIAMANEIQLLHIAPEVAEIIKVYISNFVMPDDTHGDAAHLAVASYHDVDYLLTWNCTHLANAFKYRHIEKVNLRLGLMTPLIVTPEQLFPEENNA